MDVYWLEQCEKDVPAADDWLSESESARLSGLRFAKRRSDWRLGRWTAKCAVAASLKLPNDLPSLRLIEIIAAPTGEPEVVLRDNAEMATISISHSSGIAICAVAVGNVALGCDLEAVDARSDAFIADYFTKEEQELIARAEDEKRFLLVSLLWSAKESALKALHVGLRADTRSVDVKKIDALGRWFEVAAVDTGNGVSSRDLAENSATNWTPLQVQCADATIFQGWWRHSGNMVRTVVAAPPPTAPIELRCPNRVAITSSL
jgi:4'-phosphopantetheinyl transferase